MYQKVRLERLLKIYWKISRKGGCHTRTFTISISVMFGILLVPKVIDRIKEKYNMEEEGNKDINNA